MTITISNTIQKYIITLILDNNLKFTFKDNLEKRNTTNFYFNYFYYKSISKYSFVCKQWFNYIRKLFSQCSLDSINDGYVINISRYNGRSCLYDKYTISINTEYSFFQFNHITHLFLNCQSTKDQSVAIDFISKFSNLERLTISTNNMQLVKDIKTRFSNLKVELQSAESRFIIDDVCDFKQLDTIRESIDFIHLESINADIEQGLNASHYKNVNSIHIHYSGPHFKYSDIFKYKSLQYISLDEHCLYIENLIDLVKDNDHIVSFKGGLPLFVLDSEEEDLLDTFNCQCFPYLSNNEAYLRENKLEHWIEFCQHLATNTTLRGLHLSNYCTTGTEHRITKDTQQLMANALCSALGSNRSLEFLTIPCGILSESFYTRLSEINQTIQDLCFDNIGYSDLLDIATFIKNNRSIKTLGLSFTIHVYEGQLEAKSVTSFIDGLSHNQTLLTLEISLNGRIRLLNETLKKCNNLTCTIKEI